MLFYVIDLWSSGWRASKLSSSQQQPISVTKGEDVTVRFWRCNNGKKVWYEWAVTEPACSAIHNPAGRSYTIGL